MQSLKQVGFLLCILSTITYCSEIHDKRSPLGTMRFGKRAAFDFDYYSLNDIIKRAEIGNEPVIRDVRTPLGTMRFGKRDQSAPLGTMRFGKRNDDSAPFGTMRFGKRGDEQFETVHLGKRSDDEPVPFGTMRFGKRSPLQTMRFGK